MPVPDYPVVFVEWVDSASPAAGWLGIDGPVHEVTVCRTAGFLLHETDDLLCIVGSVNSWRESREWIDIPRAAVRSVRQIWPPADP